MAKSGKFVVLDVLLSRGFMDTFIVERAPSSLKGGEKVTVCWRHTPPDDAFSANPDAPLPPAFEVAGEVTLQPPFIEALGPLMKGLELLAVMEAVLEEGSPPEGIWVLQLSADEDARRATSRLALKATNDYHADAIGRNAAEQDCVFIEVDPS